MKRVWILIVLFAVLGGISFAASPNKETSDMIIFTDGQETTSSFKIESASMQFAPGSTPITAACSTKLTDSDNSVIAYLNFTAPVVNVGGVVSKGVKTAKTNSVFCGNVFVYGTRR